MAWYLVVVSLYFAIVLFKEMLSLTIGGPRVWWVFFLLHYFSCTSLFGWFFMREGNIVYERTSHPFTIGLWSFFFK